MISVAGGGLLGLNKEGPFMPGERFTENRTLFDGLTKVREIEG
jgi:hypothetical protein